jgi:tetratricopeptide (TPR) repeat protein
VRDPASNERPMDSSFSAKKVKGFLAPALFALSALAVLALQSDGRVKRNCPEKEEEVVIRVERAARATPPPLRPLMADLYWLRALQYVGRRIVARGGALNLDDLASLDLRALGPLLNAAIEFDPHFLAVYEYGAVVLEGIAPDQAIELIEKGIRENPQAWRLYHHLGYILWRQGCFREASEAYLRGARLSGAPRWMEAMAAHITAEGGSYMVAEEIYARLAETSEDEGIRALAKRRREALRVERELLMLRVALDAARTRLGRCPANWSEAREELKSLSGFVVAPGGELFDPAGISYRIDRQTCQVERAP